MNSLFFSKSKSNLPVLETPLLLDIKSEINSLVTHIDMVNNETVSKPSINLLKKLGLTNSHNYREKAYLDVNPDKQSFFDKVMYYKTAYPFNPFITFNILDKVCAIHKLVLNPAESFIGQIPDKNLNELSNFKLKSEDKVDFYLTAYNSSSFKNDVHIYVPNVELKSFKGKFNEDVFKEIKELIKKEEHYRTDSFYISLNGYPGCVHLHTGSAPIMIAGESQLFDTSKVTTAKRVEDLVPPPPREWDPLILQPVEYGYLVITAWGPESRESEVVPAILN